MVETVKYPIGQQDFKTLRSRGCLYIDKTYFIKKIVEDGSQYYFLARPRRFGKSLFLSALQYFFEGQSELFKGLYIGSVHKDWIPYPVLHLDLNVGKFSELDKLDEVLDNLFKEWEALYDVPFKAQNISSRFRNIIKYAHQKTGQQVVILVDEYDKPLVDNLNRNVSFEHYRLKLSALYSNFKSSAEHIRLVFLTGVSRFSKLSVFSDLNNLRDITFSNEYADVCGITEQELLDKFQIGIDKLAKTEGISYEEAFKALKKSYDGYKFAETGSEIYNPWSVLNAMQESKIADYWIETGFPSLLAESLKRVNADLRKTFNSYCIESDLKGLDLINPRPLALLYQTGYLTLKGYNRKIKRFRLGIPNDEIKKGFFNVLLPYYVSCKTTTSNEVVDDIVINFIFGNPNEAMKAMQAYFAGIDYKLKMDNENNFHNAFYLLMDLIGLDAATEVSTSDGSIDIVVKTENYIYVIELKYDRSAENAIRQIEEKKYDRPYRAEHRQIFRIGVNFSSKTRCIEEWKIVAGDEK